VDRTGPVGRLSEPLPQASPMAPAKMQPANRSCLVINKGRKGFTSLNIIEVTRKVYECNAF
jgi:hypothetical protein